MKKNVYGILVSPTDAYSFRNPYMGYKIVQTHYLIILPCQCRETLQNVTFVQLIKSLPVLMEQKISLSQMKEPAIGTYSVPDETNRHQPIAFYQDLF